MDSNTIDSVIVDDTYTQWQDIYNRIKPGGNLLIISTPLKYHRVVINAEDNGFEVRDMIQYITEDGVYTIGLCRKPLSEKTVVENVIRWGVGGLNIDGCRIGYVSDYDKKHQEDIRKGTGTFFGGNGVSKSEQVDMEGRWPANLILDKEAGKILDKQSGKSKSSPNKWEGDNNAAIYGKYKKGVRQSTYSDEGGASRFFASLDTKTELLEYLTKLINPKNRIIYIATS
jgi:site-specific DNA-methyltransferase (adenine-specific)